MVPDFGKLLVSQGWQSDGEFTFAPFEMYNLVRLDIGGYSTMSNVNYGRTSYAVSLDFDEAVFGEILACFPKGAGKRIREHFERSSGPTVLQFPSPFRLILTTRLGQQTTDDAESFVPMIVTRAQK